MGDIIYDLLCIAFSGAFGGLVFGIFTTNTYKVKLPFSGKLLELGFIGDILTGTAASIAIFFIAAPLFNLKIGSAEKDCCIKVIALGILSGFTGMKLLSIMSSKLMEKLYVMDRRLDEAEKQDETRELLRQADFYLIHNPDQANIIYDEILKEDPQNESGLIGKAKVLRRKKDFEKAIKVLTEIVTTNPKAARAYYNRACYKNSSSQYSVDDVLSDLEKAISLCDFYRPFALKDDDFENLKGDKKFNKLLRPSYKNNS